MLTHVIRASGMITKQVKITDSLKSHFSQTFQYKANRPMAQKSGKGKKKKVEVVFLVCEESGDYNYTLRRKSGSEKLKTKKFCPRLRKHTLHVEKKK